MVFGGSNRRELAVGVLLARRAPVKITILRRGKVVKTARIARAKAGKVSRVRFRSRVLRKRGLYQVRVVAGKGKSARRDRMWSRKL
jgi:hypothetical protein